MFNIEGVVEIPNCGLYAKSPQALAELFGSLREQGYHIEDCSTPEKGRDKPPRPTMEKQGWSLWFAKLDEHTLQRLGKCHSCGAYISRLGIRTHKHRCEKCGAYTFLEYIRGSVVRFKFINKDRRESDHEAFAPTLKMSVICYDDRTKCLILDAEPLDGNDFNDWSLPNAQEALDKNSDKFRRYPAKRRLSNGMRKHIRRLKAAGQHDRVQQLLAQPRYQNYGRPAIAIPYDIYSPYVQPDAVISMYDVYGHYSNYSEVNLYRGQEFEGMFSKLPVPETYNIYEAWHWLPLQPSPTLHEKIIHAAGMVSRCDYYYQDGRPAFYDIHLQRMRLFVEHFTALDLEKWDAMIRRADKSGPGMIRAIAGFCHDKPIIKNEPNIGNVLVGLSKIAGREPLTDDEVTAFQQGLGDQKIRNDIFGILAPKKL